MAARLSTLDLMTGATAGEFYFDSEPVDTFDSRNSVSAVRPMEVFYSVATRQNPLAEVDTSQQGNYSTVYNSIPETWLDAPRYSFDDTSTLQNFQNLPVTEHGAMRYERAEVFRGEELNSGSLRDAASRHDVGNSLVGNDQQRVLLAFPEGEPAAVTVTQQDLERLRHTEYLSSNIIDFYIKYLERRLPLEERDRFYFFNSFFFTKLLGSNSASNDIDQCKVDYEQVRKWPGEVNLFEKDYIFIPVVRSSHWSLIIICHLNSLRSSPGAKTGSPCIIHLDSVEGKHENFKRQVRSYISRAWMERHQASNNVDQLLDLCQMKYVQAKVPQQDNGYDCGLYVLHYVEVFLRESTSPDFSVSPSRGISLFMSPHFAAEVSVKRMAIQKLILGLGQVSQEQAGKSIDTGNLNEELRTCLDGKGAGHIANVPSNRFSIFGAQGHESNHAETTAVIPLDNMHQNGVSMSEHRYHRGGRVLALESRALINGDEIAQEEFQSTDEVLMGRKQLSRELSSAAMPKPPKVTNKRKWTKTETSLLLECKVEGGRFYNENQSATRWNIIAQEIKDKLETVPSADQCRLRYDTLLKAYKTIKKYCMKSGRTFSDITESERLELKLATTLSEGWYKAVDEICERCPHNVKSQKRVKLGPSDGNGQLSPSPNNSAPLPPPAPAPAPISAPVPILTGSSKLEKSPPRQVAIPGFSALNADLRSTLLIIIQALVKYEWDGELEEVCQRLAIVQDRNPSEIRGYVYQLSELKLVSFNYSYGEQRLEVADLWVYRKFVEKVLRKNPDFDVYLDNPKASLSLSLERIRVLSLYGCKDIEHADLRCFPQLRSLAIKYCGNLKAVTGWEVVIKLGWLEVCECPSYVGFPPVHCLPSLRECRFINSGSSVLEKITSLPDFSQCVRLRRLQISGKKFSAVNSMDLSTLRFLEVLSLPNCDALTTIQGLSGLHSLTKLDVYGCSALRRVPELGCLKALTHLDMCGSGVEEIPGVQELHLLTHLDLSRCYSLETLPCLGHLKALTNLNISWSGVEVIPGVQDLVSLEKLDCYGSRLKWLPDLHHLRRLLWMLIDNTPMSTTDPSSFYYRKCLLDFNSKGERKGFEDDISAVSDME